MFSRLVSLIVLVVMLVLVAPCPGQGEDPSLLGWWAFDEGAGMVAADGSGNGNDGTLNGGATWVPGVYSMALGFDGQDGYVGTDQSLLNDLTGFTLAGWVSAASTNIYASLFGQNDLIEFGFTSENGGQIGTWMAGNNWVFVGANYSFSYPSWHHVTLAGDADRVVIYIDGQEVASDENGMTSGTSTYSFNIGAAVFNATGDPFQGEMDDVWLFGRALTQEEIQTLMRGPGDVTQASAPSPVDEAADVPRDVALSWTASEFAVAHDVYFGTTFEDVNEASRVNPIDVLVSQAQAANTYDAAGVLEFSRTYYWRVDEVNAAPDNTIFKGQVWSFTTEPFAYPIAGVIASSNGSSADAEGPGNTVNGSGLSSDDGHSIAATDMWLASPSGADPLHIQYEFDRVYKLHEMLVWNYNVMFELVLGFGLKDVTIEYSADGAQWEVLGDAVFAQAPARADYVHNTTVDLGGVAARFVRLVVNSGYGMMGKYGLSEVRFLYIPAQAREPQPADGATEVAPDAVLRWRPGREAAAHEVYFGTDQEALALVETVTEKDYMPGALNFGTSYYWKVDEVNEADAIGVWAGEVWSFATQEYAVIEDFESYVDDIDADGPLAIFDVWIDGWENGTGATVGYFDAPFAEQTIVHSGRQSMPLAYDNSAAPFYSETYRAFSSANWNGNGADTLRLFVSGLAPAFFESAEGSILMNGIGTDIWDAADEFRYVHKTLTGDGSMVARVDYLDGTPNAWAKAGVMIRQDTEAGAINTFMAMTGGDGGGATFQQRVDADGASVSQHTYEGNPFGPPYWVRLDRVGDTFSAFISPDGATWQQAGDTVTVAMADPVLIGLALTSHNADQATSAEFSNVSTTGNVALEDSAGKVAVVTNPDSAAVARSAWTEWLIPYSELTGINLNSVRTMFIGVGDRDNPTAGGAGRLFIDDIGFGHPAAAE